VKVHGITRQSVVELILGQHTFERRIEPVTAYLDSHKPWNMRLHINSKRFHPSLEAGLPESESSIGCEANNV
jgi:hypothetical protein